MVKEIKYTSGYLVNPDNFDIVSVANLSQGQETKGWLADKELASSWAEFSKTGNIVDRTAPPAPFNVKKLVRKNGKVILSWNAVADIQSSIAYFEILENDKIIGRVGGPVKKHWNGNGYYHAWNYSDQPLYKKLLPMEFELKKFNKESKYSVVVVNKAGLKSEKSDTSNLKKVWKLITRRLRMFGN